MKKIKIILWMFFILLLLLGEAKAECDDKTTLRINTAASNVTAELYYDYKIVGTDGLEHPEVPEEVLEDLESGYAKSTIVYIDIANISDDIYVTFQNDSENIDELIFSQDLKDGKYQYHVPDTSIIRSYTIKVYSNNNSCYGKEIRTIEIKSPMYNDLSSTRVCENNQAYYCSAFITTPIDIDVWEMLKKQNEELENKINEKPDEKNNNRDYINLFIAIGCIISIIILIVIKIINRKRREQFLKRQSI